MKKPIFERSLRGFANCALAFSLILAVVACGGSNEDLLAGLKPKPDAGTAPSPDLTYPDQGSASLAPSAYYNSVVGLKEQAIQKQLYSLIHNHTVRTYANLWTDFRSTDAKPNGKVWDLYRNDTNYTFGTDQDRGGGDPNSYNREHSVPKSWFGKSSADNTPIYSDLYCLYPCDAPANSERSNNPFGHVTTVQWNKGGSKSGNATINGRTTKVFEPVEDRKGDLARTYFYFATRYAYGGDGRSGANPVADFNTWSRSAAASSVLTFTTYPFYQQWTIELLLQWHRQDPVSEMEKTRHAEIYKLQNNRNPYIDHPVLVEHVWGNRKDKSFGVNSADMN